MAWPLWVMADVLPVPHKAAICVRRHVHHALSRKARKGSKGSAVMQAKTGDWRHHVAIAGGCCMYGGGSSHSQFEFGPLSIVAVATVVVQLSLAGWYSPRA